MIKGGNTNTVHIEQVKPVPVTFEDLTQAISKHPVPSPVQQNSCQSLVGSQKKSKQMIVDFANQTQPIIDCSILKLMLEFLSHKQKYGSSIEQEFYQNMSIDAFITRLLLKRPFAFLGNSDHYLLRNGAKGSGGFEQIGTTNEKSPKVLADYLSYDEMQISALLSVATPSFFINNGNRNNQGEKGKPGSFQESGIVIGMVGTRCEVAEKNEYAHMLITRNQNTNKNGYGKNATMEAKQRHRIWAEFYNQGDGNEDFYFPSFEEAITDKTGKYAVINENKILNIAVYKQRLKAVIAPFLVCANDYGNRMNKEVYVEVGRLGLGSWAVAPNIQLPLQLEVYTEILSELSLPRIQKMNFGRFLPDGKDLLKKLTTIHNIAKVNAQLKIQCTEREPAQKLNSEDENKLLVLNYAWDGNSYPGNEYWLGMLNASTDPATACYSQISELQNPLINPNVSGSGTAVALKSGLVAIQQLNGYVCPVAYQDMNSSVEEHISKETSKLSYGLK